MRIPASIIFFLPLLAGLARGEEPASMFRGDALGTGRDRGAATAAAVSAIRFSVDMGSPIRTTPVVRNGTLYLAGSDGVLHALDARTGTERWRHPTGGAIAASPATDGRMLWLASRDGTLTALETGSGAVRWSHAIGRDRGSDHYWDYYASSPVVADGLVIIGSGDGCVYAFDALHGRLRWRHDAGARVRSSVAVGRQHVVFGTTNGHVRALDEATGNLRWDFATEGATHVFADADNDTTAVVASPTIVEQAVVVGGRDGNLYSLDLSSGRLLWRTTHDGASWMLSTAYDGEHVFVGGGSAQIVQAADPRTGAEAWRFKTRGMVFAGLTLAGDALLAADFSGTAYALDRRNGTLLWQFPLGARALAAPVASGDMVYLASDRGVLFALDVNRSASPRLPARRIVASQAAPGDKSYSWFQGGVDAALLAQFRAAGYESVDEAALAALMAAQRRDGPRSVIVLADNRMPARLTDERDAPPLVRRYLDNGGKLVVLGPNPLAYVTDPTTGELVDIDFRRPARTFDIAFAPPQEVAGYYAAAPTPAGRAIGLRRPCVGYSAVVPQAHLTVLAADEFGRAQAWLRDYGGPRGTGLLQLSVSRAELVDIAEIQAAIEQGIGW